MTGFRARFSVLALAAVTAAAVAAGLAFAKARSVPVGSGIVVIDTNLAYQGGQAAGTGMVLTSSGEVLTNNHVIRGASSLKIVVPSTGRSFTARVVGYDVADDVAVLQASGASNLKTVSLGSSAAVKVGQRVKAVGNAGGTGSLSSATGKVTGLARAITVSDGQGESEHLTGLLETNAVLQAGDSGGPLLNAAGKVIGMDTAASIGYGYRELASGDGYAIPIDKSVAIVKRIVRGQASARIHVGATAFLGVQVVGNGHGGSGAVVAGVVPGGPADAAGIAPGDVITSLGGRRIPSPSALGSIVATLKPGSRVSVAYVDQAGASQSASITLASGPPQ
jgi:S1-C subfamily serine protease